jgi:hypothetical protein
LSRCSLTMFSPSSSKVALLANNLQTVQKQLEKGAILEYWQKTLP